MMPWKRPVAHEDFAGDADKVLDDVRAEITGRNGVPHGDMFKNRELWTASWQRGKQRRGLHKEALLGHELWLPKCVWCEQQRPGKRELDVEHYRPKVRITEWVGEPHFVSDTPPREVDVGPGYWWLAFHWNNYSLSCKTCNQGWKRNLFPVTPPRPTCVEGVEATERPLLLDPGSAFRTRDHFRWTIDGFLAPMSPEGYATIVTCGLNRNDLVVRRSKIALKTSKALDDFVKALRCHDVNAQRRVWQELGELGSRSAEFTSMVRWLVEERLHHPWDDLEGLPP
ncbi:hypothetical protein WMF11_29175 [Sorangium sp. So ce295]|uniref:hypothetical protein n=1 Tax=Sorangium sp. So ce295 TaxID=3133295 RepID=UPI003F5E9E7F